MAQSNGRTPRGQKTMANSTPVVVASDQSTLPVSAASLPLPSGAATSAAQTDKSQFTKITDGTDTALVTAAGEQNVLATAQPGVDIGDVTINNAAGASAVNIQDGGNSITVDGAVTTSGTVTEANSAAILTSTQLLDDTVATLGTTTYTEATTKANVIGAVRRDADTTLVDTTNEIAPLQVNAGGQLKTAVIASALPTGAATETTLGTRLSESDFDTKTGSLTEAAPASDTASSGLNGRLQRIAQRISSLITTMGSPFQAGGSIGNTSFGATQATASSLNAQVQGPGASGAAKSGNPVQVGGVFNTTQPTVTTGQTVEAQATARGELMIAKGVSGFSIDNTGFTANAGTNLNTSALALDATLSTTNTEIGIVTEAAPASDTASSGLNGRLQRIAQRITSLIALFPTSLGQGTMATSMKVVLPSDQSSIPVTLTSTTITGTVSENLAQVNGITVLTGTGATGTGSQRVTVATDSATVAGSASLPTGSNVIGALTANQSVDVARIAGVATNVGVGAAGATGTQRVVTATDSTIGTVTAVTAITNALPAGTNLMGKVGIDQTTPGTTNAISVAQIGANTVSTGVGASGTGTQRVVTATDSTIGTVTNLSQMSGTAISMNTGVRDTGTQRVTIATNDVVPVTLASTTITGTVTVDTELPAAAALADAASATTTTPTVGAVPLLMNATTVDRQRAVLNTFDSTGTGVVASGLVAQYDDTLPTQATENQFSPVRMSKQRGLYNVTRSANGEEYGANVTPAGNIQTSDSEVGEVLQEILMEIRARNEESGIDSGNSNSHRILNGNLLEVVGIANTRDRIKTKLVTLSATTAETTLIPGDQNVYNDILAIVIINTSASTNTRIDIRDDLGGAVIIPLMSIGGSTPVGFSLGGVAIPQTTRGATWTAQCATSTTDVRLLVIYSVN